MDESWLKHSIGSCNICVLCVGGQVNEQTGFVSIRCRFLFFGCWLLVVSVVIVVVAADVYVTTFMTLGSFKGGLRDIWDLFWDHFGRSGGHLGIIWGVLGPPLTIWGPEGQKGGGAPRLFSILADLTETLYAPNQVFAD